MMTPFVLMLAFVLWIGISMLLPKREGIVPTIIFLLIMIMGLGTGLYGDYEVVKNLGKSTWTISGPSHSQRTQQWPR